MEFKNGGQRVEQIKVIDNVEPNDTGTKISFKPDFTIMEPNEFDFVVIADRAKQIAYLNKGITLTVSDLRPEKPLVKEFCFEGGIIEYVRELNRGKNLIHDEIIYAEGSIKGDAGNVLVEVAMQYNQGYQANVVSYANNISTIEGGTHEQGFTDALTRILNNYAGQYKLFKTEDEKLTREDVKEGLTAIISVKHVDPIFEGQTKSKLGNKDARFATNKVVSQSLERFLAENPEQAKQIVEKAVLAQRARFAATTARETTRKKALFDGNALPGKLADCSSKNAEISELYIVEGNSAGGSAKMGRDRETQAILPLRGKVINAEKARIDKVFENAEIASIITALGTGVGSEININKLRYHKVIIMTDADVDGAHIASLLMSFFYQEMPKLIENGHLFIALPPLYRLTQGGKSIYAADDEEKDRLLKTAFKNAKNVDISRFKGLGEMPPHQLKETTMDPQKRTLLRVMIPHKATEEEAEEVDYTSQIVERLMGTKPEYRFQFIQEHAKFVENLDI